MSGVQNVESEALPITNDARRVSFNNRNETNTADAAFERLFGKSNPERVARNIHHCASCDGLVCYQCEHVFDSDDEIYRARICVHGRGFLRNFTVALLSFCQVCAPHTWYDEGACRTCRRWVYYPSDRVLRKRIFCSKKCSESFYVNAQREKRQVALKKICTGCDSSYIAKRSDSMFCSSACKQKAYRVRQGVAA